MDSDNLKWLDPNKFTTEVEQLLDPHNFAKPLRTNNYEAKRMLLCMPMGGNKKQKKKGLKTKYLTKDELVALWAYVTRKITFKVKP